ncbi:hypothetical protein [Larkinella soli]|uniref:hypothetical protein n=1 Tax=Larkinella soli TaxID=1770527 RepID=UPI000FFB2094|nr:hypothetical protein [Larkinella soli]
MNQLFPWLGTSGCVAILLCLSIGPLWAQSLPSYRQTFAGGSRYDEIQAVASLASGGFIAAGGTYSADEWLPDHHGMADVWVSRYDGTGKVLWQKTFGGSDEDRARAVAVTEDGDFLIAGFTRSTDGQVTHCHGRADYWVIRLDGRGELLWQKTFGGSEDDFASSVASTPDGGVLVGGFTNSQDGMVKDFYGQTDGWILKLDGSGNLVRQLTVGGKGSETLNALTVFPDGSSLLAGSAESKNDSTGNLDFWVVRLDPEGRLLRQKNLGGNGDDVVTAVAKAADGSVALAGYTASTNGPFARNHGSRDFWVLNLGPEDQVRWQQLLGGRQDDLATAVVSAPGEGFLVSGYTYSIGGQVLNRQGRADSWLVHLDASGKLVSCLTLGGVMEDRTNGMALAADGTLLLAGVTESVSPQTDARLGRGDGLILQLKLNQPTPVPSAETATSWTAALLENPVRNGEVSVAVRGAAGQPFRLRLLNLQGRVISDRQVRPAGEADQFRLSAGGQPEGVLILEVIGVNRTQTLKVLLLH